MTHSINTVYFKELAELNPEDVCTRALCRYDDIKKRYTISVWGDEYAVYPYKQRIERISNNFQSPHEYLYLFIIHYLLKSKETELCNEWISEKDIPGGTTFFRGPHVIPTDLIASRYSGAVEQFRKTCVQLDGVPLEMADAAYIFKIAPRIPAAVLYWEGDDEFPPESKILYDRSAAEHLASDIIFALAVAICARIGSPPV